MKKWKRIGKIAAAVAAVLVAAVLVMILTLNVGVMLVYPAFFGNAEAMFEIPGLRTGFVPQGFHYDASMEVYLISGYMDDHSASRIYIRQENGNTWFVRLLKEDGSAYDGHAGGITVNGDFVYIPGENGVDVFSFWDILKKDEVKRLGRIEGEFDTDCITVYNGMLFVGDFYRPGVYETPQEHHITTPAGDENKAVITLYRLNSEAEFGVEPLPVGAISIPGQVQGMTFNEHGQIILSTSYGTDSSMLLFYEMESLPSDTIELMGVEVPLHYLDSENLFHSVKMPPMAEEVICKDGMIYVLFESASNKYRFGNLIRGTKVYAYPAEI